MPSHRETIISPIEREFVRMLCMVSPTEEYFRKALISFTENAGFCVLLNKPAAHKLLYEDPLVYLRGKEPLEAMSVKFPQFTSNVYLAIRIQQFTKGLGTEYEQKAISFLSLMYESLHSTAIH